MNNLRKKSRLAAIMQVIFLDCYGSVYIELQWKCRTVDKIIRNLELVGPRGIISRPPQLVAIISTNNSTGKRIHMLCVTRRQTGHWAAL